jgi:TMEM175 potassium channel family protein
MSMNQLEKDIRREFQIDRLILFSDAVFAIAITFLVIDIKVPHLEEGYTDQQMLNAFLGVLPKFLGFLISFFFIGLFWTVHHRLMGYLINYDNKLLWLNLLFLLSIVLLPYTTSLDTEYSTLAMRTPFGIYTANVLFTGFMNYKLWAYIGNPKHKLNKGLEDKKFLRYCEIRSLVTPLIFLLAFVLELLFPLHGMGRMVLFLIPFIMRRLRKGYEKRNLQNSKNS